jgi:hypothetical protein
MMKAEWHRILQHRSIKNKIGIAIDCDVAPAGDLNIVAELVREGIMVWGDRAFLAHVGVVTVDGVPRRGVNADVYYLTPKGIALCDAEGIKQRVREEK